MIARRQSVESARYFLVFHLGLSIDKADLILANAPAAVDELADKGRSGFYECARGLAALIDRLNKKQPKKRKGKKHD